MINYKIHKNTGDLDAPNWDRDLVLATHAIPGDSVHDLIEYLNELGLAETDWGVLGNGTIYTAHAIITHDAGGAARAVWVNR